MIALTRITSKTVITKGFRLRGQALEKIKSGSMYAGIAERLEVPDMAALVPVISSMNGRQALCYGTPTLPGTHQIVTKAQQVDGKNISRSRKFFAFEKDQEGVLLLDYDPPDGEQPLDSGTVLQALGKACSSIATSEKLVIASASSYIYRKADNACLRGAGGLHILVRVCDASEIPELGEAINARLWLSGFGYIGKSEDGKKLVRSLIDTSVWQPERLSYDSGAECGAGLEQRRPPIQHTPGGSLSLVDVDLTPDDWQRYHDLVAAAKGQTQGKAKSSRQNPAAVRREREAQPVALAPAEPMTPAKTARITGALLHVPPSVDYTTWLQIGMALKTSCGDAGFPIWDNWSRPASSYPGTAHLRAKWASFDRTSVTIRTLFYHAKQYGWTGKPARVDLSLPVRELPTAQHEPLAETVSVETAREDTAVFFKDKIVDNASPFTITAAQITVGVGKTSALKQLFNGITRAGKAITIVARDKKQCESYETAGAFWRHGRENTKEGFANDWHCPKAESGGNVERLAKQEHRLQQMCKSGHCEHGNAYMRDNAIAAGREPDEKIIRFFREKPEHAAAEPCMWFEHMKDGQAQDIRVVTAAGLSQSDMLTSTGADIDILAIDESLQWSHSQFLGVKEIRGYIETLQALQALQGKEPEDSDARGALAVPIAVFADLAKKLGEQAGTGAAGEYQPIAFDIGDISDKLKSATDEHGVAIWERPKWKRWLDLVDVPLRALAAIRDGITAGSLSVVDGRLHITYLHPALAHAREKGIQIMILDATLDSTARAIASEIRQIVAEPNVDWRIDPRWFLSAKNDGESLKKEMAKVLKLRAKMEAETGHQSYIICRKALAMYMLADELDIDEADLDFLPKNELWDLSIDARIGWYGWHDVAHDDWKKKNCILWGQMPVTDNVRMQEYADHRAALRLLGLGEDLPLPDNRWVNGQEVVTGDHAQTAMARLPEQPEVRDWLLRRVSDQKIQAAGRSRAVCQVHKVTIWQVGGYPMTGLAEHGIRPTYKRLVAGLSGAEVAALHAAQRHALITDAAALVVASGRQITRTAVREFAEGVCKSLITNKACGVSLVRDGYIYIYQHRTKKEALDSNEIKELQEVLFTNDDGVWSDEYAAWRDAAHAGLRLHFAQDRGQVSDMPVAAVPVAAPVPAQEAAKQQDAWEGVQYSPVSEDVFRPDPDEPEDADDVQCDDLDVSVITDEEPARMRDVPPPDDDGFYIVADEREESSHD